MQALPFASSLAISLRISGLCLLFLFGPWFLETMDGATGDDMDEQRAIESVFSRWAELRGIGKTNAEARMIEARIHVNDSRFGKEFEARVQVGPGGHLVFNAEIERLGAYCEEYHGSSGWRMSAALGFGLLQRSDFSDLLSAAFFPKDPKVLLQGCRTSRTRSAKGTVAEEIVMSAVDAKGARVRYCLSGTTGLLMKVLAENKPGTPARASHWFEDYRSVDGHPVPHTLTSRIGSHTLHIRVLELDNAGKGGIQPTKVPPDRIEEAVRINSLYTRMLDAMGGVRALASLKSSRTRLELVVSPTSGPGRTVRGESVVLRRRPNLIVSQLGIPSTGKYTVNGYDGNRGWSREDEKELRVLKGHELQMLLQQAEMSRELGYGAEFPLRRMLGDAEVEGRPCAVVSFASLRGEREELCFDKESGFLLRIRTVPNGGAPEGGSSITFSDHRKVGAVTQAFVSVMRGGQPEVVTTARIRSIEHDVEADPADFGPGKAPGRGTLPCMNFLDTARRGDREAAQALLGATPSLGLDEELPSLALTRAAREGHPDYVGWLISRGVDVNKADSQGWTPLVAALFETEDSLTAGRVRRPTLTRLTERRLRTLGNPAGVTTPEVEVNKNALLKEVEDFRHSSLEGELLERKSRVVMGLLGAGATPAGASRAQVAEPGLRMRPLVLAVRYGFGADVIEALIRAGESPRGGNDSLWGSPLVQAALRGDISTAGLLVKAGAPVDEVCESQLDKCIVGINPYRGGSSPLMNAAAWGELKMMSWLLEKGASLETTNKGMDRALHFAAAGGHAEAVRMLVEKGARCSPRDFLQSTPLHYAALSGHLEAVRLLIDHKAELEVADEAGFTPLLNAVEHNHVEVASLLLDRGASLNAMTQFGKGPLAVAATAGSLETARMLLERKVSPDGLAVGQFNRPLHEAIGSGKVEMVKLLLENGARTDLTTRAFNMPALHYAVISRPIAMDAILKARSGGKPGSSFGPVTRPSPEALDEILGLLLGNGAHIDGRDSKRNTPLHLAAYYGDLECAKVLLRHGANPELKNMSEQTPAETALGANHGEISDLINDWRAKAVK